MIILKKYKKLKKLLLLVFFFLNVLFSFSQTITITDEQSKVPLEWVVLISENPKQSVVTNAKGQADISSFKGSKEIIIRSLGYKSIILSYKQLEQLEFVIELETYNLNLDEIVISATRWRQTTDKVPSKIISISPKEVALQNPQTAADLLGISGKVFIQKSQQGGGSPMIRGFATNRLLYTVDGVRMNSAIFRGGNIQNVINLDPFATENTEVLFGPGSVIYGSDAIGGVMSFQTLIPELSLDEEPFITGKALLRTASANNEKTGHLDVNVGWKKWAVISSFSSWDYDHLKQGSHGPDDYIKDYYVETQNNEDVIISQNDPLLQIPTAYSQINFMQKVRYQPTDKWDFQYGFHYSETSPYGRYDRHNRTRNGTARYGEWNYGHQKWMMNNLLIHHQQNNSSWFDEVNIRLAQQTFEESRIDRSLNSLNQANQIEEVKAYSVNIDFVKVMSQNNTLYYGAEYVFNDVKSRGFTRDISTNDSQVTASRYPESKWSSIGFFVNDEHVLSEKITLQAGLRYNRFILNADFTDNLAFYPFPFTDAKINKGALTGSIGAIYKPTNNWMLKASFGTAFRSPNVDDIGKIFDSEPGSVTVPNPNLDAEYAYNFDIGVAKVFGKTVKLDVTAFYTNLQNALVRRDFQLNGESTIMYDGEISQVQAIQNAAVANVYGVQAGIEVKLPVGFRFSSDINYQEGEEELDDGSTSSSRHAAPLFGTTRLRYVADRLSMEWNVIYQGQRSHEELSVEEQGKDEIYAKDENGNNYAPSWHTINLKAMYQLTDSFSVSGGLENITDQRYRPYSSGISGAGRNFILSLRADF